MRGAPSAAPSAANATATTVARLSPSIHTATPPCAVSASANPRGGWSVSAIVRTWGAPTASTASSIRYAPLPFGCARSIAVRSPSSTTHGPMAPSTIGPMRNTGPKNADEACADSRSAPASTTAAAGDSAGFGAAHAAMRAASESAPRRATIPDRVTSFAGTGRNPRTSTRFPIGAL